MLNKTDNKKDSEILDLLTKKSKNIDGQATHYSNYWLLGEEQNRNLPIDHTLNTRFCWLSIVQANESEEKKLR